MDYKNILVETKGSVGIIKLNRPKVLNAVNVAMIKELNVQLKEFEKDENIKAIILTGNDKAFAAGIDINEVIGKDFSDVYNAGFMGEDWEYLSKCSKPVIAAVAGFALGVGCELAMMCDFIIGADNAVFGQPEITLGMLPSLGGAGRLTRFVGKAKATEMILTGRSMEADEAEKAGLVSRTVPLTELMNDAIKTAKRIASMSMPIVKMARESVNQAYETSLSLGAKAEKKMFYACFATEDKDEGINAFVEKRQPEFKNR